MAGKDGKPRAGAVMGRGGAVSGSNATRAKKRLGALRAKGRAEPATGMNGESRMVDRSPSGGVTGVVVLSHRMMGQAIGSPSLSYAYWLRSTLRPIRVAPVVVYDGAGQVVGRIEVDPVTGRRQRVEMDAPPGS